MRFSRVPPLLVVAVCALSMWVIARFLPGAFRFPGSTWIAAGLFAAGTAICVLGVRAFRRAATTVNPLTPDAASSLVADGIYRFSRNPMYLGFALWLLAWGVLLESIPALLIIPAFVLYMNRFQIRAEEHALQMRFGGEFDRYMNNVRRWL
ncbi:MAG TPA: isoprenylcysteine carboxylmethyltransferase family protein [Gammaproteobacteria bacterium]